MKRVLYMILISLPLLGYSQEYGEEIAAYRRQAIAAFQKNEFGPIRPDQTKYLDYFPADKNYQVQATVEILYNEPTFRMPTYDGTSNEYKRYAILHFILNGEKMNLTAYQSVALFQNPAYKHHLFLPFSDLSNANQTYEGGRYLDLNSEDILDGKITLDFNRAYNPYCAYSDGYRCPIPPMENNIQEIIPVGEKKYKGSKNERTVNRNMAKNFNETEIQIITSADQSKMMHVYQTTNEEELAILRKPSEDIKFDDPLLETLANRMLLTVNDPAHAGVGIAAPQVGINKNLIWVQRLDKDQSPFEFYINPKIIWRSKLIRIGAEGCLSIPDIKQEVNRSYAIRLQYETKTGEVIYENIEGFTAVIFQHEVDHLYGILFPDRIQEQEKIEAVPLKEKLNFLIEKGSIIP